MADPTHDPFWAPDFIKKLVALGVVPANTRSLVITARDGEFVAMEVEVTPHTDNLVETLTGTLFQVTDIPNDGGQDARADQG